MQVKSWVVDLDVAWTLYGRYLYKPKVSVRCYEAVVYIPGTTPALRLGPDAELAPLAFPLADEPLAVEPRGRVGAEGPVAGVDALGRDMVQSVNVCWATMLCQPPGLVWGLRSDYYTLASML